MASRKRVVGHDSRVREKLFVKTSGGGGGSTTRMSRTGECFFLQAAAAKKTFRVFVVAYL